MTTIELSSSEELKDMGFEILNMDLGERKDHLRKISFDLQLFTDGTWVLSSNDSTGQNSDIANGDLIEINNKLEKVKEIFLNTIKEIDERLEN